MMEEEVKIRYRIIWCPSCRGQIEHRSPLEYVNGQFEETMLTRHKVSPKGIEYDPLKCKRCGTEIVVTKWSDFKR